jgi:ABC-type bacteriocin/lantibiotic exporter with double-glycine peptidase domain
MLLCANARNVCLFMSFSRVQVLFLDEATSALDEQTETLFQRVLEEKLSDTTIFCIAHRLETLRWCRTRIEMGNGKLLSITDLPTRATADADSAAAP